MSQHLSQEQLIAQTASVHQALLELWNVKDDYNVFISIFPSKELYDAIDVSEVEHPSKDTQRMIRVKYVKLYDDAAYTITLHKPNE